MEKSQPNVFDMGKIKVTVKWQVYIETTDSDGYQGVDTRNHVLGEFDSHEQATYFILNGEAMDKIALLPKHIVINEGEVFIREAMRMERRNQEQYTEPSVREMRSALLQHAANEINDRTEYYTRVYYINKVWSDSEIAHFYKKDVLKEKI